MTAQANVKANVHATGQHRDQPVFQRLKPLLGDHESPCLSLYLPTFRSFPDSQQNQVKYRNALKELKSKLEGRKDYGDYESLLGPFERLAEDSAGFTLYAPASLVSGDGNVYARDLHARDTLLLAAVPNRPVFLLRHVATDSVGAARVFPVNLDSARSSWLGDR